MESPSTTTVARTGGGAVVRVVLGAVVGTDPARVPWQPEATAVIAKSTTIGRSLFTSVGP